MKSYTYDEVMEFLTDDEFNYPSNRSPEELCELHHGIANLVSKGLVEMAFDENGRPLFKSDVMAKLNQAKKIKNLMPPLTMTAEMLN